MTDPFEALGRLADADGDLATDVDPRFHADLVAEARRVLSAPGAAPGGIPRRSRPAADPPEWTVQPLEPSRRRQAPLLAAACAALVVAVVAVLSVVSWGQDNPAVTIPPVGTTTAPPPSSTAPASTAPASTVPVIPDDDLIDGMLLDGSELGLQEQEPVRGWEIIDEASSGIFDPCPVRRSPRLREVR